MWDVTKKCNTCDRLGLPPRTFSSFRIFSLSSHFFKKKKKKKKKKIQKNSKKLWSEKNPPLASKKLSCHKKDLSKPKNPRNTNMKKNTDSPPQISRKKILFFKKKKKKKTATIRSLLSLTNLFHKIINRNSKDFHRSRTIMWLWRISLQSIHLCNVNVVELHTKTHELFLKPIASYIFIFYFLSFSKKMEFFVPCSAGSSGSASGGYALNFWEQHI